MVEPSTWVPLISHVSNFIFHVFAETGLGVDKDSGVIRTFYFNSIPVLAYNYLGGHNHAKASTRIPQVQTN